jgi:hypothetical protein
MNKAYVYVCMCVCVTSLTDMERSGFYLYITCFRTHGHRTRKSSLVNPENVFLVQLLIMYAAYGGVNMQINTANKFYCTFSNDFSTHLLNTCFI